MVVVVSVEEVAVVVKGEAEETQRILHMRQLLMSRQCLISLLNN